MLHAVPVEVTIDGGRPLKDACGLSGQRLEIVAHLVTVAGPALRNLLACLERCHIEVKGVVCGELRRRPSPASPRTSWSAAAWSSTSAAAPPASPTSPAAG